MNDVKRNSGTTNIRGNLRAQNQYGSSNTSQLTEEYLKVLNYSHIGINQSNYCPYVRNEQVFNWQQFSQENESKHGQNLERELYTYNNRPSEFKKEGCGFLNCFG
jgi:hypothetical protein